MFKSLKLGSQTEMYLRLLGYIKPYWLAFLAGSVGAVLSGAMDGAIAWLSGHGMQRIFLEGHQDLIYWVPAAMLVVTSSQGIFRFLESCCIRYVGGAAIRDLRNELFRHLQKQPLVFFQNQSSGVIIGRMVNDIGIIENAISETFRSMISRSITLIALVLVMLMQSWTLSLIALSILSLIVVPVSILGKKIRKSSRYGQEAIGDLVSVLSESIQGTKIVQSFNLEQFQIARFLSTNQNFFSNTMKAVRAEAMLSPILAIIGATGIAAVMWVAGYQVLHHQMTLGSLTSFIIALLLLYSPIKNLGRVNGVVQPALAAANRVFEMIDLEPDLVDSPDAQELPEKPHRIEFDSVSFQYPGHNNLVLRDIKIEIPSGRMVALVGLSGSGKSTLANLVPRFFDPTSGAILIDGQPLSYYTMSSLRSQIALVTQDNFLFNTSVQENIQLGKLNASFSDIETAARNANCHNFILELPQGYKTMIGERGMRLSGGQQQRIAIARAFLKDAPILILDEATSSLDNESEAMVQAALNNLMKGRTVIVIAHRLSTVEHADQILVLDAGQVVEVGTHRSLVEGDSTYARLLKARFERPVADDMRADSAPELVQALVAADFSRSPDERHSDTAGRMRRPHGRVKKRKEARSMNPVLLAARLPESLPPQTQLCFPERLASRPRHALHVDPLG